MRKILIFLSVVIISLTPVVAGFIVPSLAYADVKSQIQSGIDDAGGASDNRSLTDSIPTIINILLFLVGMVAVIIIIYAGFQYVTAAGDASKAKNAQATITYAVIGLIVAILAYAIVNFVTNIF